MNYISAIQALRWRQSARWTLQVYGSIVSARYPARLHWWVVLGEQTLVFCNCIFGKTYQNKCRHELHFCNTGTTVAAIGAMDTPGVWLHRISSVSGAAPLVGGSG